VSGYRAPRLISEHDVVAHFDFELSPTGPLHLLLLINDARALLDPPQR
jgi:hypothetical protein